MSNKHQLVKKNRKKSEADLPKITKMMLASVAGLLATSGTAQAAHSNEFAAAMRANHMRHGGGLNRNQFHALRQVRNQDAGKDRPALLGPPVRLNENRHNNGGRFAAMQEHQVTQINDVGRSILLDRGANIDLTAETRNITLGDRLIKDGNSVTIEVGGAAKTVQAGDTVTAAEYVAVKQVLAGGAQQLLVGADGRAEGGTVDLNSLAAAKNTMRADSLTVSRNVTAVGDLDRNSSFRLNGDLTNFGSVYVVNTKGGAGSNAEIAADNISNADGALISSAAGSRFGNRSSAIDLSLNANSTVTNSGVIESSGVLSISAGKSIDNHSGSIVRAEQDINLSAPQINNQGMIASTAANIAFEAPNAALVVDNREGTIQALAGDINVRAADYQDVFNSNVFGGDLYSQKLNMHTGQGLTEVQVGELTGEITGAGSAAHVSADTETLTIGKVCLTGDPTFFNNGNIVLGGIIQVGQALAILASGNITSTQSMTSMTARNGAGAGQNIFLVAGFSLATAGGPVASPNVGPFPGVGTALAAGQTVTASTAGATGGNVDLSGSKLFLLIDASSGTNNQPGGNVQIMARANGLTGGRIVLPTNSLIASGGLGTGANGTVTIVGGSASTATDAIVVGGINATGGSNVAGNVLIRALNPGDGGGTTFDSNGVITLGGFTTAGALVATGGRIVINGPISATNNLTINAGPNNLQVNAIASKFSTNGGAITITSLNDINLGAGLDTDSGAITVTAVDTLSSIGTPVFSSQSATGTGGAITFQADSDLNGTGILNLSNSQMNANGNGASNGGNILLQSGSNSGLFAPSFIASNNTSTVTIGGSGTTGQITLRAVQLGANGTLTVSNAKNGIFLDGSLFVGGVNINAANDTIDTTKSISIVTNSLNLNNDSLDAGSDPLTISQFTPGGAISLFGAAGGTLNLPTALLSQITADNLSIGFNSDTGIMVANGVDISALNVKALNFASSKNMLFNNLTFGTQDLTFDHQLGFDMTSATGSGDLTVIGNGGNTSIGQTKLSGSGSDLSFFINNGDVFNIGDWQADNINIVTFGTGQMTLNAKITGTSSLNLATQGALIASQVQANITTPLLTLNVNKDIGAVGAPVVFGPGVSEIRMTSSGGSAFVQSTATAGVKLGQAIVNGDLIFAADGSINVSGNLKTTDGDISVTGKGGTLKIDDDIVIAANSPTTKGDIFLGVAVSGGNKKTDKIDIGDDVQILASAGTKPGGNVTIQLGPLSTKIVTLTKAPNNVQYTPLNGGIIQGGKSSKPFTAGKKGAQPLSIITADNATVLISNTFSTKNIILGGGVIITGDPPATSSSMAPALANLTDRQAAILEHQVTQINDDGQLIRLDRGAEIDLTAEVRNIQLGDKLIKDGSSITIAVGGNARTVQAGDSVTAAEYVAVKQVLSDGSQELIVDASGRAIGGTVDLNSITATKNTLRAESLTVAENVTAYGDLDGRSSFVLTGDLTNHGSLYVVNTNGGAHRSADIAAENINNSEGALISSAAGTQFGNRSSEIDLSLSANSSVTNDGVIESSGLLSISAGKSIAYGNASSIKAETGVYLSSPQIRNEGTVSSNTGNIVVDSPVALAIDNSGGTFLASAGDIDVRSRNYNGVFNTDFIGGDLFSQKLNMHTGQGLTEVHVGQLTGEITGTGSAAHVSAATDTLTIGKVCLTGDPTFFNTGNIVLGGVIIVGQDLAILATGNITSTSQCTNITARGAAGTGQNIFLAAGFSLSTSGAPTASPTVGPFPGTGTALTAAQTVTAVTAGATGGNVDLTGSNIFLLIDSSAGAANKNGGNVQIVARANGAVGGKVLLPANSFIVTGGQGTGINGNVDIAGGSTSAGAAITVGKIETRGGGKVGGNVIIRATNPGDGGGTTFDANGVVVAGGFDTTGAVSVTNGRIDAQGSINANNDIQIDAGPGNLLLLTGDDSAVLNSGRASIALTSLGDVTMGGFAYLTKGQTVSVKAANNISTLGKQMFIQTSPVTGNGGIVSIIADSDASGTGSVNLTGMQITSSGDAVSNGGPVTIQSGKNSSLIGPNFISSNGNASVLIGSAGNTGAITVGGVSIGQGGALIVQNNAGSITLNNSIFAGSINMNAASDQIVTTAALSLSTDLLNLNNDTLDAGTKALTIDSFDFADSIGLFGAAGTLSISQNLFNQLDADILQIGSFVNAAVISANAGTINASKIGKVSFVTSGSIAFDDLNFAQADVVFDSSNASGAITIGDMTGAGGNVTVDSGNAVTIGSFTNISGGDFFVFGQGNTTVGTSQLSGSDASMVVTSTTGTVTMSGAWSADTLTVSSSNTAVLNLASPITATTSVLIASNSTLTNTQVPSTILNTPLLTLQTALGIDIGASGTPFAVGPNVGQINVTSFGNAFVHSDAAGGVKLGESTVSKDFEFSSKGPLTITDNVTVTNGNLSIVAGTGGTLLIEDNVNVKASSTLTKGNVIISNGVVGGNKKTDKIVIGDDVQIRGDAAAKPGGNVTIQLGPLSTKIVTLTKPPNNVQYLPINNGVIQGGKSAKPFTAGKKGAQPTSFINADNATVLISNTFSTKSISLGGNVTIDADPPSLEASDSVIENSVASLRTAINTTGGAADISLIPTTSYSAAAPTASPSAGDLLQVPEQLSQFAQMGNLLDAPATDKQAMSYSFDEDNSYAIGYNQAAESRETEMALCSDGEFGLTADGGMPVLQHGERVSMNNGKALFMPLNSTVVQTPHGSVHIKAGSMAIVCSSNEKLAVFDLYDNQKGSITIESQGSVFSLAPGRHLTLAKGTSEFAQVNSLEAIPHRNVSSRVISNFTAHSSEFSLPVAINSVKPLKCVVGSKHPQAKTAAQRLMKTTAILLTIGGQQNYQHYFKAITAILPR